MPVDWSSPGISEALLDVDVEDGINKTDKKASVVIDDPDGSTLDSYPKGTEIRLDVDSSDVNDLHRFSGWVAGNNQSDGTVTLELNAFDHFLFQTFSKSFDNETIAGILRILITDYTPISWDSSQVSVANNRTYTRDWRGMSVNEAIAEMAWLSAGEQYGVDDTNTFFFEPASTTSAPRDFVVGEYYDYDYNEDHRVEVNRAVVFYGEGDDRRRAEAEDTGSQSDYGSNMGVSGGVETVLSKFYPSISDESVAQSVAESLLERNQSLQVIELETWEGFDVVPNQSSRVVIPEHDIDDRFQVTYTRYKFQDDETTVRFVENSEGALDFIKKSKQETTRIDHQSTAASDDPESEAQSAALTGSHPPSNPTALGAADMAAGETRATRDYVSQGKRFELLSAGVTNDSLTSVSDLVAKVIDENDSSTLHSTESKREDGIPLVTVDGPTDLRFEVANNTGSSQTGVDGRWVYRIRDLFQPGGWQFQVSSRHLGTPRVTTAFDENPTEKWSVSPSNAVRSSAHVGDESVYVGTNDNDIRALAIADGSEEWSFATSDSVRSSPAVHNGSLYVGSDDGNVYALNADDGTERWRKSTGGQVRSSPAVVNGTVFVGSDDGTLYALDVTDGSEVWTFTGAGDAIRTAPAVVSGTVVVGSLDNTIYAVNTTDASLSWSRATGGSVRANPTVAKGTVFVGSEDNELYALSVLDGALQWRHDASSPISAAAAVVDGVVYVGTRQSATADGALIALDQDTGTLEWRVRLGGPGIFAAPTVLGGQVIVGWNDGVVRAYTAEDVAPEWQYDTGASSITTSPAIRSGVVYIGTP